MLPLVALAAITLAQPDPPRPPDPRPVQVLYVEGAPRWEYRWHRALLGRGEKRLFAPRVLLTEADADLPKTDPLALAKLPAPADLGHYELIVLGDVDPATPDFGDADLKRLAAFVTEGGGGLVLIAGPHHSPHAFKNTPLEDLLPVTLGTKPATPEKSEEQPLTAGYRVRPTVAGLRHPALRLGRDDDHTHAIWDRLPAMYRFAQGYAARPDAEVLAVHATEGPATAPHPLVVTRKAGKGRVAFVGFDESWRWRRNEGERHYQTFWTNLWRTAAGRQ
jgi:uncharacterized membrane protein